MDDVQLTIRMATPRDTAALRRLAALDSKPAPAGPVLLAERYGVACAAVALHNGSVVADPFEPTADVVALLRRRRYQLVRQGGDLAPLLPLLRRLVPDPVG